VTLFLAPILSHQYVIWLLPLAAICWAPGDLDLATPRAISLLTLLVTALFLKSTIEQLPSLLTAERELTIWTARPAVGPFNLPAVSASRRRLDTRGIPTADSKARR
jgi:hypothetical protein